ncbi:unnamed protein product [Paramecium pentaurelia]|uniref:protein-serine/threonine phosphatase n=1 Tax=Paramecium pentaurelia TaxID=43138 RepID=A0A8S1UYB1_9CILI|nr:unnamed protein product [Paramecium pentaurelia]
MRPKYQQTQNDSNTQVRINIKHVSPIQIEVLKQSGERVVENEKIGVYIFENQNKSIMASSSGYIVWAQNQQVFEIPVTDQYFTIGVIYKNKNDMPNQQEEFEINTASTSSQAQQNYTKLNFSQLSVKNCQENIQILKWRVNVGDYISPTMILGICVEENQQDEIDLRAKIKGRIIELAKTKTILSRNDVFLVIDITQTCNHLKIEKNYCLICNEKIIRNEESLDLNYSDDISKKISKEIVLDILKKRKLIMVLDLDQTILHAIKITTSFNKYDFCEKQNKMIQSDSDRQFNGFHQLGFNIKEHFLEMACDQQSKFIIKLRPYFEQFFLTLIPLFDIFIYTKASKSYADFILNFISNRLNEVIPEHKPFFPPQRVLSREDTICSNSKSLNRLFYPGIATNLLVILDDNAGMWNQFKENLIHTKPFVYFNEHGSTKDGQGIATDIEKEVQIYNKNDFWLYTITQKLKEISDQFWKQVKLAQDDPNFIIEFEQQVCKAKKIKTEIIEETNTRLEERTPLDLIINRKISVPTIYQEMRRNVLNGLTLFFAISEAHEESIKRGLEQAKDKAVMLGAKVYREFKEDYFVGQENSFVITVGRRKIRSIMIAQEKNVPIIHYKWIEDCDNYLFKADYKLYIEKEDGNNKNLTEDDQRDYVLKCQLMKI